MCEMFLNEFNELRWDRMEEFVLNDTVDEDEIFVIEVLMMDIESDVFGDS